MVGSELGQGQTLVWQVWSSEKGPGPTLSLNSEVKKKLKKKEIKNERKKMRKKYERKKI